MTEITQPHPETGQHMLKAPGPRSPYSPLTETGPTPELPGLTLDGLRTLRRDAQQEEADLSYLRRLLQGRIDILRAETGRRTAPDTPVLDRLPEILTDTPSAHRSAPPSASATASSPTTCSPT